MVSGKLDKVAVLKAICAGFQETTEPAICLSEGLQLALLCLFVCVCVLPNKARPVCKGTRVHIVITHFENPDVNTYDVYFVIAITLVHLIFIFSSFGSFLADIETNECLHNNGGCWQDKAANVTACKVCSLF